ncbi:MAG: hypothetical protein L6Q66_05140, partial [Bacteroidia bacterium]|nr:hypothetical protein [Bacteroidia bacterium]
MPKMIMKYLFIFLLILSGYSYAQKVVTPEPQNTVKFTENKNQWDSNILYHAFLDGGSLFLEKNTFTYSFYDQEALHHNHILKQGEKKMPVNSHAFRVEFRNAEMNVKLLSKQKTSDYNNYFIGNDRSKWASHVNNYKEVVYDGLYSGIDLQVIGMQNSLKYNFYVSPFVDADIIQMKYEGVEAISLEKGALKIKTSINEITEQ